MMRAHQTRTIVCQIGEVLLIKEANWEQKLGKENFEQKSWENRPAGASKP